MTTDNTLRMYEKKYDEAYHKYNIAWNRHVHAPSFDFEKTRVELIEARDEWNEALEILVVVKDQVIIELKNENQKAQS